MAVAALKASDHGGDGEGQKKKPDDDGDMRRLLQGFEKVLLPWVDHVEVAVDGGHSQEGDTCSPVEEEHEEHGFAHHLVLAPALAIDEVVRLHGQTEKQEDIRQHQVEEEDIVAVGFPELQLENEEMEDGRIERQGQDENDNHNRCVEFVQRLAGGITVLDDTFSNIHDCC